LTLPRNVVSTAEAKSLLAPQLAPWRDRRYGGPGCDDPGLRASRRGQLVRRRYQVQILAFWDDKSKGHVRLCVAINDGGIRAFVSRTDDFIMAPDDSFVGELAVLHGVAADSPPSLSLGPLALLARLAAERPTVRRRPESPRRTGTRHKTGCGLAECHRCVRRCSDAESEGAGSV
jgi:hypothetical protein